MNFTYLLLCIVAAFCSCKSSQLLESSNVEIVSDEEVNTDSPTIENEKSLEEIENSLSFKLEKEKATRIKEKLVREMASFFNNRVGFSEKMGLDSLVSKKLNPSLYSLPPILFAGGSTEIDNEEQKELIKFYAGVLLEMADEISNKNPKLTLSISVLGYASTDGDKDENERYSNERAKNVADLLKKYLEKNLKNLKIRFEGRGIENPVSYGRNLKSKKELRRVCILHIDGIR